MKFRITIGILSIFWLVTYQCYAADVFFVNLFGKASIPVHPVELGCQFYGLDIESSVIEEGKNNLQLVDALKQSGARAIAIAASALAVTDAQKILSVFHEELEKSVPFLITAITPATDSTILSHLSGGTVIGCKISLDEELSGFYSLADIKDITQQLAGQAFPFPVKALTRIYSLVLKDEGLQSKVIIKVVPDNHGSDSPIFVKTNVDGREVFFQSQVQASYFSEESTLQNKRYLFFEILPLLIFLKYSCGECCWHSAGHYANLTVDDPWLTEPYGHLSYKGLLREMQKAYFHTTIGFIPWNFNRSQPEVVSLFREYPDRFSISIHGNNHDYYEFYKYEKKTGDPWPAKRLDTQESNIKQALARMSKFTELTGISYDRVMVFPHGIAPAETLALLKKYNFLATVNARNVPLGSKEPLDPLYPLRPATLAFENFASVQRYNPTRSQSEIALDLFLGNPILLYAHHDFFHDGIDAFNKTAEMINNLQPDIQWRSLGYIAKHLYLQKLRDDGDYDVLAFSNNFILENTHQRDITFFIKKEESLIMPIKQVTLDGQPHSYHRSGNEIILRLLIPAGESRHIVIEYENNLYLGSIDVSKKDFRVNLLRRLSDFRDMTLSTNVLGRTFIDLYYEADFYKLGLGGLTALLSILILISISGGWYLRRCHKKR